MTIAACQLGPPSVLSMLCFVPAQRRHHVNSAVRDPCVLGLTACSATHFNDPMPMSLCSLLMNSWRLSDNTNVGTCRFQQACGRVDSRWTDQRQHDAQEYLYSMLGQLQVSFLCASLSNLNDVCCCSSSVPGGVYDPHRPQTWLYALSEHH